MVPVVAGGTAAPAAKHPPMQPEGAPVEPVRVCQVVGNMMGGGVEHVVMNYYRNVDRSKVQFDFVITESSIAVPREEIEGLGGHLFVVPAYGNVPLFERSLRALFRAHPEWRIVHSHMNALSVFPLRAAFKAGVPVRIAHSHSAFGHGEPLRNAAKAVLRRFSNVYPTNRFACSRTAGDWLFGGAPYEIVYNAIDLDRFAFDSETRRKTRASLGIADGVLVVGHAGRFMQTKNQRFLLRAFRLLLDERPDAVLLLVGDGSLRGEMEELAARLGIVRRVRFLGQREDMDRLYQAIDVVAVPSLYEGLGLTAIEAQAAGLPCLLSDRVPAEANLTGECRYLPIDDPRRWAAALASVKPRSDARRASIDRTAFSDYDIVRQAAWLTDRYLQLHGEAR